jgi:hypothetical protein
MLFKKEIMWYAVTVTEGRWGLSRTNQSFFFPFQTIEIHGHSLCFMNIPSQANSGRILRTFDTHARYPTAFATNDIQISTADDFWSRFRGIRVRPKHKGSHRNMSNPEFHYVPNQKRNLLCKYIASMRLLQSCVKILTTFRTGECGSPAAFCPQIMSESRNKDSGATVHEILTGNSSTT